MNVAFIGLGNMGSNIAHCILKAGFDLTVWNRTVSKMQPLVDQGAKQAMSAKEATSGANVVVTAIGHAGTRSVLSAGTVSARRPVLLSVVHFASGSAALDRVATRILDATKATIRKYGFARATLKCNTDNAGGLGYNVSLSRSRCRAVSRYLTHGSRIGRVAYQQNAYAYLRPFAPNTSRARMAANRRVEIWVK